MKHALVWRPLLAAIALPSLLACSYREVPPVASPAGRPEVASGQVPAAEWLGLAVPSDQVKGGDYFADHGLTPPESQRGLLSSYGAITGPIPGLAPAQLAAFRRGGDLFSHVFTAEEGAGPLFNSNSCAKCHEAGGVGGPGHEEAHRMGLVDMSDPDWAIHSTGFYEMDELGGPVKQGDGLNGGEPLPSQAAVAALADSLALQGVTAGRNVVISARTTPNIAGDGLLTAVPDATLLARAALPKPFGIGGRANLLSGALFDLPLDGRVGKLGHKAHAPDNEVFFADAAVQELGLSNTHNPYKNVANQPAMRVSRPDLSPQQGDAFMAFCAALAPVRPAEYDNVGRKAFYKAGCAVCHFAGYWTAATPETLPPSLRDYFPALGNKPVPAYTDLLLHNMGRGLADGFTMASAGGADWRTAPLWGLRYKVSFLHDGSAPTLDQAIARHMSEGSEANQVVENYSGISLANPAQNLTAQERGALIEFLKKL